MVSPVQPASTDHATAVRYLPTSTRDFPPGRTARYGHVFPSTSALTMGVAHRSRLNMHTMRTTRTKRITVHQSRLAGTGPPVPTKRDTIATGNNASAAHHARRAIVA